MEQADKVINHSLENTLSRNAEANQPNKGTSEDRNQEKK